MRIGTLLRCLWQIIVLKKYAVKVIYIQHILSASIMKRICTPRTLTLQNCMFFTIFKNCFLIDTLWNLLLFAEGCHNFLSSHPLCFMLIRDVYLRHMAIKENIFSDYQNQPWTRSRFCFCRGFIYPLVALVWKKKCFHGDFFFQND